MVLQNTPKYPIGIQSFKSLREESFLYVDKTAILYDLVNSGKYYFLSRPRRFGKSLMLSTLESYFLGEKALFEGLAMEKLETEWSRHPVFHLDLSAYRPGDPRSLEEILDLQFSRWESEYGIENKYKEPSVRFNEIITRAHSLTGRPAAILIDEYDAPMIAHMDEDTLIAEVRDMLRSLYMNIKTCDRHIRFAMITGVSRFNKLSVFSGLNNLHDISLADKYNEICGITEEELGLYFKTGIEKLADELEIAPEQAFKLLKDNYDGYHFTKKSADIYNPFSLLLALENSSIDSYWYQSGKATLIVKRIDEVSGYLHDFLYGKKANASTLKEVESYMENPVALLFQAGYLTIKGYDPRRELYTLGIPNREVKRGIMEDLLASRGKRNKGAIATDIWDIRDLLDDGKPDEALGIIKTFLSRLPYDLVPQTPEIYFENNLYLIFSLVGIDVRTEWKHSAGRVDMLLLTQDYIYVMELKLDGTAEQALAQIDDKGYALPYADDPRRLFLIGINFSRQTRNIDTWLIR